MSPVDELHDRLRRAGWSVGEAATTGGWLVTGTNVDNVVRAVAATRATPTAPPAPDPLPSSTSPSAVRPGCTMPWPAHACLHSSAPVAGARPTAPELFTKTTCRTPPSVAKWGEL
jgi:hypothetical protein